jgi:hypothetical protein
MEIIIQAEYLDFALLDFKAFLAAGLYSVASVQSLRERERESKRDSRIIYHWEYRSFIALPLYFRQ